jgi:hypothetical protein
MWMAWLRRRCPRRDSRRHLDRRGAVIGGEAITAGEAGHVDDAADHHGGDDRADAEDLGEAGT